MNLFGRMEKAYDEVATAYGFKCKGCEENCCWTRFYHHTLLEYLYLYQGFFRLPSDEQTRLQQVASRVNRSMAVVDKHGRTLRSMCPLNLDGHCTLYFYRPMICRLHGIPHEMRRPGSALVRSPGCGDFDQQCGQKAYILFDRTPFYTEMAQCEQALRQALDFKQRIKLTVAQMIAGFRR